MQAHGSGGALRLRAGVLMRGMFVLYLVLIALGLALFIVLGLVGR